MRRLYLFLGFDDLQNLSVGGSQIESVRGAIDNVFRAGSQDSAVVVMLDLHDIARLDVLLAELHAAQIVDAGLIIAEAGNLGFQTFFCVFNPTLDLCALDRRTIEALLLFSHSVAVQHGMVLVEIFLDGLDVLLCIFHSTAAECLILGIFQICCSACDFRSLRIILGFFELFESTVKRGKHTLALPGERASCARVDVRLREERDIAAHILDGLLQGFAALRCHVGSSFHPVSSCRCAVCLPFHLFFEGQFFAGLALILRAQVFCYALNIGKVRTLCTAYPAAAASGKQEIAFDFGFGFFAERLIFFFREVQLQLVGFAVYDVKHIDLRSF